MSRYEGDKLYVIELPSEAPHHSPRFRQAGVVWQTFHTIVLRR